MKEKIKFKKIIGGLVNEDVKFLYWCWENKKCLNAMRLKLRPGKSVNNLDSGGTIRSQLLFPAPVEKPKFIERNDDAAFDTLDRIS